jgi:hypothetical protein
LLKKKKKEQLRTHELVFELSRFLADGAHETDPRHIRLKYLVQQVTLFFGLLLSIEFQIAGNCIIYLIFSYLALSAQTLNGSTQMIGQLDDKLVVAVRG